MATKLSNQFAPIPDSLPADWKAECIVYSKYRFAAPSGQLQFSAAPSSEVIAATDIHAFVKQIAAGDSVPGTPGRALESPRTPLDIAIDKRCYLVIQLDPSQNWAFSAVDPAITTKVDYGADNGELRRVGDDGQILAEGDTSPCHIAYFSVCFREAMAREGFNIHVEIAQVGYPPMPVIIDPDDSNGSKTVP